METVYISVEKNADVFEQYKELWRRRMINGIMVGSMREAIERATNIRNSKTQCLYFVSISSDDINYMSELPILSEATDAPILIATSHDNEDEHHEAIEKGAFFYGQFCEDPEKNIRSVVVHVKRYYLTMGKRAMENVIVHGRITLSHSQRTVCMDGSEVDLTNTEFNVLSYLFENRGSALSYEKIYGDIWKEKASDSSNEAVKSAVKRIRKKLGDVDSDENIIIENIWGYGYKVPIQTV